MTKRRPFTRKNFLRTLAGTVVGVAAAGGYMRWLEPGWASVTHTRVALPPHLRTPGAPPLRILHLSDLHAHREWVPLPLLARAVELGLAQKPDLICLTGDFITQRYELFPDYVRLMSPLAAAAPTYACLGNHDGGPWAHPTGGYRHGEAVREFLRAAGIDLLHNSARETTVRGRRVQLFGAGDWWAGECSPTLAFHDASPRGDAIRLVLNHNPDAKTTFASFDWDLMLCGHTHGGQIGIPLLARRFAPVQDKRFIAGLYPWENRQLFITRGVGNLHHARFLCRPEVSLLDLA